MKKLLSILSLSVGVLLQAQSDLPAWQSNPLYTNATTKKVNSLEKQQDEQGNTHMHSAVLNLDKEHVNALLLKGDNVNVQNKSGQTPLHLLVKNGPGSLGQRVYAIIDMIEYLCQKGSNMFTADKVGNTALHYALTAGIPLWPVINELLKCAPDIYILQFKNSAGIAPIDLIYNYIVNNRLQVTEQIKPILDVFTPKQILDLLILNYFKFEYPVIQEAYTNAIFLNQPYPGTTQNKYPLHVAIGMAKAGGSHDGAGNLLLLGADPNSIDSQLQTPLHLAVEAGLNDIAQALIIFKPSNKDFTKADINAQDNNGDTPLHIAAREGRQEQVDLLLEHGADSTFVNNQGKTPDQLSVTELIKQSIVNFEHNKQAEKEAQEKSKKITILKHLGRASKDLPGNKK